MNIRWHIHAEIPRVEGLRDKGKRRRNGYEARGNQADEEGGEEVVPFGNFPEADQHLHIRGQAVV